MLQIEREILLDIAKKSILYGFKTGHYFKPLPNEIPSSLKKIGASFVTIYLNSELRGCIGTLNATNSLAQDVSKNAYSAAFQDMRFSPLKMEEAENLRIEISILSEPVRLNVQNESGLISYIAKNKCGLILKYGNHQATFLPSVWDKIVDSKDFLKCLKEKAGLDREFWSNNIEIFTYNAEKIF